MCWVSLCLLTVLGRSLQDGCSADSITEPKYARPSRNVASVVYLSDPKYCRFLRRVFFNLWEGKGSCRRCLARGHVPSMLALVCVCVITETVRNIFGLSCVFSLLGSTCFLRFLFFSLRCRNLAAHVSGIECSAGRRVDSFVTFFATPTCIVNTRHPRSIEHSWTVNLNMAEEGRWHFSPVIRPAFLLFCVCSLSSYSAWNSRCLCARAHLSCPCSCWECALLWYLCPPRIAVECWCFALSGFHIPVWLAREVHHLCRLGSGQHDMRV